MAQSLTHQTLDSLDVLVTSRYFFDFGATHISTRALAIDRRAIAQLIPVCSPITSSRC